MSCLYYNDSILYDIFYLFGYFLAQFLLSFEIHSDTALIFNLFIILYTFFSRHNFYDYYYFNNSCLITFLKKTFRINYFSLMS